MATGTAASTAPPAGPRLRPRAAPRVAPRGDGAGRDYFEAGVGHYSSWITVDGGPPQQVASSSTPRLITAVVPPSQDVCVHVEAVDRVGNATPEKTSCGRALGAPPMP